MNDFLQSLRQLWRQLGLNQRISLVLTALALLGVLAAVIAWSQRTDYQLLYGGLSAKDSAQIISQLDSQGIRYKVAQGGAAIFVPAEKIHSLRAGLAQRGIPTGDGVGLEIFDRSNFGVSDFVQRTNFIRAISGELSRTIAQMEGVRSARVMIVQPETRLLVLNNPTPPSASVFVDTGSQRLPLDSVNAIRHLVSRAVQGLDLANIAVIDQRGHVLTADLEDDPALTAASAQIRFRKSLEDYFTAKVQSMLETVVGPGNSVVRVNVEIDPEAVITNQEKFDPDGQVARTTSTTEDTSHSTENETGGAVGTASNLPADAVSQSSGNGVKSEQNRKNKSTTYEISSTRTTINRAAGSIKGLTAAVFLNQPTKIEGNTSVPAPRTPEEIQQIRQLIRHALGLSSRDPEDLVALQEIPFPAPAVNLDRTPAPSDPHFLLVLLPQYLPLAIGLLVIFIFFQLLRRQSPQAIPVEILADLEEAKNKPVQVREVTPEMINKMISEHPEAIGVSLREWVSEGSSKE